MVRKVRLGADESFGGPDPQPRRDSFDDLDDLVFDTPPKKPRQGESGVSRRRSPRPRDDEPRRHLADADWMNDPTE